MKLCLLMKGYGLITEQYTHYEHIDMPDDGTHNCIQNINMNMTKH